MNQKQQTTKETTTLLSTSTISQFYVINSSNNNNNKTSTLHDNTSSENNNFGNNNNNDKNNMPNQCHKCGRILKSVGGLKLHIRSSKGAVQSYTSDMSKTTENKYLTQITVSPLKTMH